MQSLLQLFILFAFLAGGAAFRATACGRRLSRTSLQMQQQAARKIVPALFVSAALALNFNAVQAANYGGFGSTYSEVINPKDAVLSDSYKSEDVKGAAAKLAGLQSVISGLKSDLTKDRQVELASRVAKELDAGAVRTVLNKYNEAFSGEFCCPSLHLSAYLSICLPAATLFARLPPFLAAPNPG